MWRTGHRFLAIPRQAIAAAMGQKSGRRKRTAGHANDALGIEGPRITNNTQEATLPKASQAATRHHKLRKWPAD